MPAAMIELMQSINVMCIDAYAVAAHEPMARLDSWELKPFAIVRSGFAEVLYLDADNVPARDPTPLFDTAGYIATGAVLWSDRHTGTNDAQPWLKRSDGCEPVRRWRPLPCFGTSLLFKSLPKVCRRCK